MNETSKATLSSERGPFHVAIYDKDNKLVMVIKQANFFTPERDKVAQELAVIVINQCSGGMGSPMLTKARELLSLLKKTKAPADTNSPEVRRARGAM